MIKCSELYAWFWMSGGTVGFYSIITANMRVMYCALTL